MVCQIVTESTDVSEVARPGLYIVVYSIILVLIVHDSTTFMHSRSRPSAMELSELNDTITVGIPTSSSGYPCR